MTLKLAQKYFYFALGLLLLSLAWSAYTDHQKNFKIDSRYLRTHLSCSEISEDGHNRAILHCIKVQRLIEL